MTKGSLILVKLINGCGLRFQLKGTTVTLRVSVSASIEFLPGHQQQELLTADRVKFTFLRLVYDVLEPLCACAGAEFTPER